MSTLGQANESDLSNAFTVLIDYGALGAILVIAILFMWYLHRSQNRRADDQIKQATVILEAERARADRLEDALAKQNTVIQEKVVPLAATLAQAAQQFSFLTERVVDEMEFHEQKAQQRKAVEK